ncbi:hypothetical protein DB32_005849 [Sandaracinus amylolyticus]|uniref:Uncharacterized protein n=1 Tax=Sandaracinus amylolyticus TaxID=927083 RepID=A0A0F6W6G1_9BACT|nr:hypothetical protein DB32_005849 [Sandaracinus amylolyticus]
MRIGRATREHGTPEHERRATQHVLDLSSSRAMRAIGDRPDTRCARRALR